MKSTHKNILSLTQENIPNHKWCVQNHLLQNFKIWGDE